MNNHYTGYELELNQSRQASIRAEFERQAQSKSLNEAPANEDLVQPHKQTIGFSILARIVVSLLSLVVAIVALAYFILGPLNNATAVVNKSESPGASKAEATNLAETTPTSVMTPSLAGSYTVRVVAKDIPSLLRFEEPKVNKYLGDWSVEFDNYNNFTASLNDQLLMQGHFEITPDQITFSSSQGTPLCGSDPAEMTGTYSWHPGEQGAVRLFYISDKCYPRSLVLTSHTLNLLYPVQNPIPTEPTS